MDTTEHQCVRVEGADEVQLHDENGLVATFSGDDYEGDSIDVELHEYDA